MKKRAMLEADDYEDAQVITVDVPVTLKGTHHMAGFFELALMENLEKLNWDVAPGKYRLRIMAVLSVDDR